MIRDRQLFESQSKNECGCCGCERYDARPYIVERTECWFACQDCLVKLLAIQVFALDLHLEWQEGVLCGWCGELTSRYRGSVRMSGSDISIPSFTEGRRRFEFCDLECQARWCYRHREALDETAVFRRPIEYARSVHAAKETSLDDW